MAKKDEAAKKEELEVTAEKAKTKEQTSTAAADKKAAEKPKKTEATEEVTEIATEEKDDKKTAKAGKRSEKSLKEAEDKAAKEARKEAGDTTAQDGENKPKQKQNPTRSRLERRGKTYRAKAELIEKAKTYSLKDALELAVKTSVGKFDSTIEVHVNLNVDPRQADQNIRSTVSLPHGTGKAIRVAVFAPAAEHAAAKKAGADIVGEDDFLQQLDKEQLDFDVLISTPQLMPKLGKYARLLGPRGLMPNPKSGTVTANVAKAVSEAKAGRVEYRVDKQAIVHMGIGKASFDAAKLHENAQAFMDNLQGTKPASIKGAFIKGIAISSTMGPGIKVDTSSL